VVNKHRESAIIGFINDERFGKATLKSIQGVKGKDDIRKG